jgi:hypothetical protein
MLWIHHSIPNNWFLHFSCAGIRGGILTVVIELMFLFVDNVSLMRAGMGWSGGLGVSSSLAGEQWLPAGANRSITAIL